MSRPSPLVGRNQWKRTGIAVLPFWPAGLLAFWLSGFLAPDGYDHTRLVAVKVDNTDWNTSYGFSRDTAGP
jgi:hypothetical protein